MENNTKTLDMAAVKRLMEPCYELIYITYRENLDHEHEAISRSLKEHSGDTLRQKINEIYSDACVEGMHNALDYLQQECKDQGYDPMQVDEFFEANMEAIQNEIFDRDKTDVFKSLLENTMPIPVRVELHSNYDVINSNWLESYDGYSYMESYFGDMADKLNLNPSRLKWHLNQYGIRTQGRFPCLKERNGKEWVDYRALVTELYNSHTPENRFTLIATLDPMELFNRNFNIREITIPAGNRCGFYSKTHGGGSLFEMPLLRPVTISLEANTPYTLSLDMDRANSIQCIYGVNSDFFGEKLNVVA